MATFFTSDHHFGDARRLAVDRRPFDSVEEMDRAMAERWNAAVGTDDEVWHLGDLTAWREPEEVAALLDGLHGRKHLIVGNNDGPATLGWPGWASVGHYAEVDVDGTSLVLCHYPFRTWNGMRRGVLDLHGHSHGRLTPIPRQFDVGVDVFGSRPVRLEEIVSARARGPRRARLRSPGARAAPP